MRVEHHHHFRLGQDTLLLMGAYYCGLIFVIFHPWRHLMKLDRDDWHECDTPGCGVRRPSRSLFIECEGKHYCTRTCGKLDTGLTEIRAVTLEQSPQREPA